MEILMSLDLNNIDQSSNLIDRYFFYPFYDKLSQIRGKHYVLSWISPIIGITDGIASSIQAIGGVAEATFKGIGNLAKGGITCDSNSLKRGSLQLLLGVGVIGTLSIPIILFRTLRIAGGMMFCPKETSETQAENYRKKVQTFTCASSAQVRLGGSGKRVVLLSKSLATETRSMIRMI